MVEDTSLIFGNIKKEAEMLKKGTMKLLHGFFRLRFMLNVAYPQQKLDPSNNSFTSDTCH